MLILAIVFNVLSPTVAMLLMLLPVGAVLAFTVLWPGRRLKPAYRNNLFCGFFAMSGALLMVRGAESAATGGVRSLFLFFAALFFAWLGIEVFVLTFIEKVGMKYE